MVYSSISKCNDDFLMVRNGIYYGLVDFDGVEVLPAIYTRIYNIKYNLAVVGSGSNKGIAILGGGFMIPVDNINQEIYIIGNGIFKVKRDNKFGIVTASNISIIPNEYDRIIEFITEDAPSVLLFLLLKQISNNKFIVGVADSNGNILIPCSLYNFISPFKKLSSFSIVALNGKYGIISINNLVKLPVEYDEIYAYEDKFICKKAGVIYLYDALLDSLIELIDCDYIENFKSDYAVFSFNSKKGILDWSGNKVIEATNIDIQLFNKIVDSVVSYSCWVKNIQNTSYEKIEFPI